MRGRNPDRAKRSLGQNFLVDPNLQRKIADELEAGPSDVVLEVGPGHGELSAHLVGTVAHLVLIEKDADLARELRERWAGEPSVRVIEGDALDIDLRAVTDTDRDVRILSNLPYNVTSPLLFAFLAVRPPPLRLVVMVQREVGERIVARPGSKTYGALSVGVQAVARAELRFGVGRQVFRPRPAVDSAVLRIDPIPERVAAVDADRLRRVTRALFNRRRKQLQRILRTSPELGRLPEAADWLRQRGIDPRARPETLTPEQIVALANQLPPTRDGGVGVGDAGSG